MKNTLRITAVIVFILGVFASLPAQTAIFVAVDGSDSQEGTIDKPLATLKAAKDKIRSIKSSEGLAAGGITVFLRSGTYRITSTLSLGSEDSGAPGSPVTYRAYQNEKVILDGSQLVAADGFAIAGDNSILHASANGKVFVKEISDNALANKLKSVSAQISLSGKMMNAARFPNLGFAQIDKWTVKNESIKAVGSVGSPKGAQFKLKESANYTKWNAEINRLHKTRAKGYMSADWHKEEIQVASVDGDGTIRLKDGSSYGIAKQKISRTFMQHLLCELDEPGEWFFDNQTKKMYMWPYGDTLTVNSRLELWAGAEVFNLSSCEYVNIQRMTIQNLGGGVNGDGAVTMTGYSKNCQVAGMTFRNISAPMTAINILPETRNCGALSCDFYDISNSSRLYGGSVSATSVEYGYNYIENCHFTQLYSKDNYGKATGISGAGNIFRNNLVHNENGQPITHGGVDHIMEKNEVFNVGVEEGDGGAFYTGANLTSFGNVIQHNFVHHIMSVPELLGRAAFFSDDMDAGETVRQNVLYKGGWEAIKMNKGGGHDILENIVLDCYIGIRNGNGGSNTYNSCMNYLSNDKYSGAKDNLVGRMLQTIGEVGWDIDLNEGNWNTRVEEFWTLRYPVFKKLIDAYAENNSMNHYETRFHNNCFSGNKYNIYAGSGSAADVQGSKTINMGIFSNPDNLNFSYNGTEGDNMPVIPFDQIGLYVDQYRTQVPDKDEYRSIVKTHFKDQACHTGDKYDYLTINDRLYYNTGLIVMNSIPESGPTAPIMKFKTPDNGQSYVTGSDVEVEVEASDEGWIQSVSLFINDSLVSEKSSESYKWGYENTTDSMLKDLAVGSYLLKAIAKDNEGHESNIWTRLTVADSVIIVPVENVALGKQAMQSSHQYPGLKRGEADDIVDGLVQGVFLADSSWNSTTKERNAWVEVNLGDHYNIHHINVWNRIGASSRLTNFYVLVSDYPFASNRLYDNLDDPKVSVFHFPGTCKRPTEVEVGSTGQYIRVQLAGENFLHIAELEVMVLPDDTIPVNNVAPKAVIANDRKLFENQKIFLDGSESFDFEGGELSYEWTMPEGVVLENVNSVNPSFFAPEVDVETNFYVTLKVSDGELESVPVTKKFKVVPDAKPIANAGKDISVQEGEKVVLDGSESYDPEGKPLTYEWVAANPISLSSTSIAKPEFVAPAVTADQTFTCVLKVNDGNNSSGNDYVEITVTYNQPPIALAGDDQNANIGDLVLLNATQSYDPEEEKLVYQWEVPEGWSVFGTDTDAPFFFVPEVDETSEFAFILSVNDGLKLSKNDTLYIEVLNPTGIENAKESMSAVYPNPARKGDKVLIQTNLSNGFIVRLLDQNGKILKVEKSLSSVHQLRWVDDNPSGVYVIEIMDDNLQIIGRKKLIII